MRTIPLLILIFSGFHSKGQVNILDCLSLKDSVYGEYQSGEYKVQNEVIDLKNGYYAMEWHEKNKEGEIINAFPLFEAAVFKNADETWSLGISEFHADMQCSWHKLFFYEISKNGDTITEMDLDGLLPKLNKRDFLSESSSIKVLEKYLPIMKEVYLGPDATIDDAIDEVYAIHFKMPVRGLLLKAELTVCDYIPLNQVDFSLQDWEIIEHDHQSLILHYDRKLKAFKPAKTSN